MTRQFLVSLLLAATAAFSATDSPKTGFFHRTDAGVSVVAGFNGMASFGGIVELTGRRNVWSRNRSSGWLNIGGIAGYQYEPFDQWQPALTTITGAAHRFEALATTGMNMWLPPRKHLVFGVGIFGGWIHYLQNGTLENPQYAVSGSYRSNKGVLASGSIVTLGWRINDRLNTTLKIISPLPYAETTITSWSMAALGISMRIL